MSFNATKFWRKSYQVEALRLTLDNYKKVADYIGWEYYEDSAHQGPYIQHPGPNGDEAVIGDWLVRKESDLSFYYVFNHEDFLQRFGTHSERLATDEKYAKVFQIVVTALQIQAQATYHGDTDGMDLVAIETTKKLLEEL
jgi:hypothetical protein